MKKRPVIKKKNKLYTPPPKKVSMGGVRILGKSTTEEENKIINQSKPYQHR